MEREDTISSNSMEAVISMDDLLVEILLLLPIESIIRFKSVSKRWLSLITNPTFYRRRNPSPNPAVGLFLVPSGFRRHGNYTYIPFSTTTSATKPPFRSLDFTNDHSGQGIMILHSCNGLFLCRTFGRFARFIYYVYNPTSNKFSIIPELNERNVGKMYLSFDPVFSPHYKIVNARSNGGNHKMCIDIYSSETGVWTIGNESFNFSLARIGYGMCWNGAVLWMMHGFQPSFYYFKIDHNLIDEMPLPVSLSSGIMAPQMRIHYFGESCNHMHCSISSSDIQPIVYELKRDFSEWFVKYKIDLLPIASAYPEIIQTHFNQYFPPSYSVSAIFHLVRGKEDEDAFLVLIGYRKAVRYNFVLETFETLNFLEKADEHEHFMLGRHPFEIGFQYIQILCHV